MRTILQTAILALASLLHGAAAACFTNARANGLAKIVGYRTFPNQSLAIVDVFARLLIYSSTGTLIRNEKLVLPTDPTTGNEVRVAAAIIGNSSELYLQSAYQDSYRYSAGAVQSTFTYGVGSTRRLSETTFFISLPDMVLTMYWDYTNLAQVNGGHIKQVGFWSIVSPNPLNISYAARVSGNPLTREWAYVGLSKRIFIGGFAWNAAGYWEHSPATTTGKIINDGAGTFTITGSIGLMTGYLSYVRLVRTSTSPPLYDQYLVLRERLPGTNSVTRLITGYYVHCTAIHPTIKVIYLYTTWGDLYSVTFNTPTLSLGIPTLVLAGAFLRYAEMEVLDSTTLIFKTGDSMATFDLTTNTIRALISVKPSYARDLPGMTKMLVAFQNLYVKLYDSSTHALDAGFTFNGKIREIIVNQDPTKPRFYMLLYSEVRTYSYSGGIITLLNTVTTANIFSMISGMGYVSIIALHDIDIFKITTSRLMVLVYAAKSSTEDSVGLFLNEQTLAYLQAFTFPYNDLYFQISIGPSKVSPQEKINLYAIDYSDMYYFDPPSTLTSQGWWNDAYTYDSTYDSNKNLMKTVFIPGNVKSSAKWDASQTLNIQTITYFDIDVFRKYYVSPSYSSFRSTYTVYKLSLPRTIMDSLVGSLALQRATLQPHYMFIWWTDEYSSEIAADDIPGGIIYQMADNTVYITDTVDTLTQLSPTDCFSDPSTSALFEVYADCLITNCAACNHFNVSQCKRCNSGLLLSPNLNACNSVCNPAFAIGTQCYQPCPIEYYHYKGPAYACVTDTYCSSTLGKKVLGSQCVNSCPSGGTTNASNYCVAPTGKAAEASNTASYVTICPGGELYWEHYKQCTAIGVLPTTGYTTTATTIYCDGATHFYDVDSRRCLQTCGFFQGISPTMGKFCSSAVTCTTTLAMYTDSTVSPNLCVSSCSALLWLNLMTKSCLTSCPGGTYYVISTRTCESSCPGSTYLLSANSSCLTSTECITNAKLVTPSTLTCVSTCGGGLYLQAASSQCLTSAECTASSKLATPSTLTCVSTCGGGLYLQAASSQCLTSAECTASSKLATPSTLTCVSTCGGGLYLQAASSQCLTSAECTASSKLATPSTLTCVSTCGGGLYLQAASSQCLTSAECTASSKLATPSTLTCVSTCGGGLYLQAASSQCLTSAECTASSKLATPSTLTCVSTCGGGLYLQAASSQCLTSAECTASSKLATPSTLTCVSTCGGGLYLQAASSQCLTSAECTASSKLATPSTLTCVSTCGGGLYLQAASSQCLTSAECTASSKLATPSTLTCVSTCGGGLYLQAASSQCLTSAECTASSKLATPSTLTCVSTCGGGLYLQAASSQCLTSAECTASSKLATPSTLTCVSTCGGGLYLQAASSQCLTNAECLASFSSLGKISLSIMTCTASCAGGLYLLTPASSCLTSAECLAVPPASGGSLKSEADAKCVASCSPSDYLLVSSSQCLTAAACLAAFTNAGLLSLVDKQCVASCGPAQYKDPATSQCLTSAECQASHSGTGLLSQVDRQCVTTCAPNQFLEPLSRQCLLSSECWTLGYLAAPTSKLCEGTCTATEYKDAASHYCYTAAECTALGLSPVDNPGNNLCQVAATPTVSSTCAPDQYTDTVTGACLTKPACNSLSKLVVQPSMACTSPCPVAYPYDFQGECHAQCQQIIEESNGSCVSQCSDTTTEDGKYCSRQVAALVTTSAEPNKDDLIIKIQLRFIKFPSEVLSTLEGDLTPAIGSLCLHDEVNKTRDCQLTLVRAVYEDKELVLKVQYKRVPPSNLLVVEVPFKGHVYFKANNYRSYIVDQVISGKVTRIHADRSEELSKIRQASKSAYGISGTVAAATPFVLAGSIDLRMSSVLCLAAQTYAKLTLLTYMNFTLEVTALSSLYYDTFREFLDQYNEQIIGMAVGDSTIQELVDYICEMGFAKYCFVKMTDNFWISKFLDFMILIVNFLLAGFLYFIFSAIKKENWKTALKKNIKGILLLSFLLDNNLSFQFNLLVNLFTTVYRDPFFTTLKAGALIFIIPYLAFYGLVWFRKRFEKSKFMKIVLFMFSTLTEVLKDLAAKDKAEEMTTVILIHDLAFTACLMTSKFAGMGQPIFWAVMEIVYLVVIIKRRFLANTALLIRQIVAETMFLLLSCAMTATHFEATDSHMVAAVIFGVSVITLWLDLCFSVGYTVYQIVRWLRLKNQRARLSKELTFDPKDTSKKNQILPLHSRNSKTGLEYTGLQRVRIDQINPHRFMSKKQLLHLLDLPSKPQLNPDKNLALNMTGDPSMEELKPKSLLSPMKNRPSILKISPMAQLGKFISKQSVSDQK
jgi:hypothetical protein